MSVVNVLGLSFVNDTFNNFVHNLEFSINHHVNTFVVTANPEITMYALKNQDFHKAIFKADYLTPDGIGIVKATQKLHHPIPNRITGYDIFKSLLAWGNKYHKSAYFIGAKQLVINKLKQLLKKKYPNLRIAGIHNGYFDNPKPLIQDIHNQHPDMVFLAMGAPKQEELIAKYRHANNGLWIGIGGSFDTITGVNKRAPQFWINHHIEWLYRLLKNPSRLKRALVLPKFVWLVHKQAKQNHK